MILINGQKVTLNKFPDETLRLNPDVEFIFNHTATICWHFESNEEMIAVMFLANHVRRIGADRVNLIMPYIPNARQDRVKNDTDVFTLTYKDETTGQTKTELGAKGKVGAEAYLAQGKVSGGFTIFGIKIDAGVTGKAGGAGVSAEGNVTTGGVSGKIGAGLGLGAGVEISIDWSNFSLW